MHAAKNGHSTCPIKTIPAGEIEAAVVALIQTTLITPEVVARTYREVHALAPDAADEQTIMTQLQQFNDLWDELFPAEQARIVRLLVDQVTVHPDHVQIELCVDGLYTLIDEWRGAQEEV
jgi:hypothetical protein